ncbi:uncharacterized protein LOC125855684 [Solanum stenotomum]|uniref:uncharacterized protein LOC125855684 n=1 Tax=Solanum stenotomum TaxID=172797 RepID=UPI0020D01F9A|nr:uncharacterized protein LOC125855684 [Solanum stenotomum]
MHDYINAEDTELWDIILDGPYILSKPEKNIMKQTGRKLKTTTKQRRFWCVELEQMNTTRFSACETAKKIWDCFQTTHEGTHRAKESKVDMLTTQYENFIMEEGETILEMNSRFTSITNELRGLCEPILVSKQVRKILKVLLKSWQSKVDAITEAKDIMTIHMDELIGNLKTYEMNKKQGTTMTEEKKEKSISLKTSQGEVTEEDDEMADYPSQKKETHDTRPRKRDLVPDHARMKAHADQLVRNVFVVWGDDSSESEEDAESYENVSMMAIEDDENVFSFIFSLMAKSDDKEDQNELSLCEDENSVLNAQMFEVSIGIGILETDSLEPSEGLGTSVGGKRKLSVLEEELKEKLKILESKLVTYLETNSQMRKDLSKVREELSHSLKWTDSSKILSNLSNQSFNGKKGLGRRPIEPPYNPHRKYVSVSNNLLCTHYGRNGHLKEKCESLRKAKERHVKFVRFENDVKKGHKGPGPRYHFRKNTLPP